MKTYGLLAAMTALLLWIGNILGGYAGIALGLIIAIVMNVGSYWYSHTLTLKMFNAKEVSEQQAPKLFTIVKDVAQKAGIPMPKVYIIKSEQPNAFATGRDPEHSAVAVTHGIMDTLDDDELKGVIAHEISHIKHRDTLIATITATIAGVISFVASMAQWAAIFGGFGRDDDGGNIVELLALAIIAPLVATLLQLGVSRSREYLADARGASFVGSGEGLARALTKLEQSARKRPIAGRNTAASLFIVNPLKRGGIQNLFSTHPPIEERVRRLRRAA